MKSIEQAKDYFLGILSPLFPKDADISGYVVEQEIRIQAYWYLENEHDQSHKHSRPILIKIVHDVIEDYIKADGAQKKLMDQQLIQYVKQQLESFNPDHNFSTDAVVPETEWIITKEKIVS